jgi:hypothetical protein
LFTLGFEEREREGGGGGCSFHKPLCLTLPFLMFFFGCHQPIQQ